MNVQELFPPPASTKVHQPKKQLGQEDFMELLVAQMKNQDPSNPADNGEFLAQISQISMVSGIDKLGASMGGIADGFASGQAMQAAALVGHQVLSDSNVVGLEEGKTVDGWLKVPEFSQGLNIQVRDMKGTLVKTIDSAGFKAGLHEISWDGHNERGEQQNPGDYVVTATALVKGEQVAVPLQLYNTVESVSVNPVKNVVELELAGRQRVNFAQVSQYR
jgi:flagellar basal-body rod modification protein FlgD